MTAVPDMSQVPLFWPRDIIVDNFAGGGGATGAVEEAFRAEGLEDFFVDFVVNHAPEAIACHKANHPRAVHFRGDVWSVKPRLVTRGRRVLLAWFSPDCRHFSRAKGAAPVSARVRHLPWTVIRWARDVAPRIIMMENVAEILTWGPLGADGRPDKKQSGRTFKLWVRKLRALGYAVEWKELRAHDYGAATTRKRLFLVARNDGLPIVWPEPTHGPGKLPYKTARDILDFDLPCPSIFGRKKPLALKTQLRIARGLKAFSGDHVSAFYGTSTGSPLDKPIGTITAIANHHALVQTGYGERKGQKPRSLDLDAPLGTIMAGGNKHAVVTAFVSPFYGGYNTEPGIPLDKPLGTITTRDHHAYVEARSPGKYAAECRAFIDEYVGKGALPGVDDIGLRMLSPRELFRAQGFPDSYIIDPLVDGKPLTIEAQQRNVGNSVAREPAVELVRGNIRSIVPELLEGRSRAPKSSRQKRAA